MHQLFRIGSGFERFTLMDDIQLAVTGHAGTSRDEFADDDIFLEAEERIFLAFDRCFGEDTGGFLEGSGGEEGVGRKSCLGVPRSRFSPTALSLPSSSRRWFIARNATISTVSPGSQPEPPGSVILILRSI